MWILVGLVVAVILAGIVVLLLCNKMINDRKASKADVKRHIVKSYAKAYRSVKLKDGIKVYDVKDLKEHGKLMDWYHRPKKGGK